MLPTTVYITVEGIPAKAEVTDYRFFKGSYKADNPEDYFDRYEMIYTIYDRKGYPAPWLQKKLDSDPDLQYYVERQISDELEIIQKNL